MDETLFVNYAAAKLLADHVDDLIRRVNHQPGMTASPKVIELLGLLRIESEQLRDELKQLWEDF